MASNTSYNCDQKWNSAHKSKNNDVIITQTVERFTQKKEEEKRHEQKSNQKSIQCLVAEKMPENRETNSNSESLNFSRENKTLQSTNQLKILLSLCFLAIQTKSKWNLNKSQVLITNLENSKSTPETQITASKKKKFPKLNHKKKNVNSQKHLNFPKERRRTLTQRRRRVRETLELRSYGERRMMDTKSMVRSTDFQMRTVVDD